MGRLRTILPGRLSGPVGPPGGPGPMGPAPCGGCCIVPGCCLMSLASPALVVLIPVMAIRAAAGGGGAAGFLRRAVLIYQADLSALTPPCPHVPSCSQYAAEALESHGAVRGSWLTLRRLLRCRPGAAGGHDPVPARS